MLTSVQLLSELASSLHTLRGEYIDISIESRNEIMRKLEDDLEGSSCAETLRGLSDLVRDDSDLRPAVAKVLDSVSWETMGLLLGCLERSLPSRSNGPGADSGLSPPTAQDSRGSSREDPKEDVLSERLVLEITEIFSPKELHIIALEHLHAYSGEKTVRAVLTVLRRSTERMPPVQRAKFLGAAMQPAIRAMTQMSKWRARAEIPQAAPVAEQNTALGLQESSRGHNDEQDEDHDKSQRDKNAANAIGAGGQPSPKVEEDFPSHGAYEAAAVAADAAVDFIGPLLNQAFAERARALGEEMTVTVADRKYSAAGTTVNDEAKILAASDRSLVAYVGFSLAALEVASETSACAASSAAAAVAPDPFSTVTPGSGAAVKALVRTEERLVALVMEAPAIDLRFVLFHNYRLTYANRMKRCQSEGERVGKYTEDAIPQCTRRESVRLAELALTGAMPWTSRGVSCVAHLVACNPKLRERWLPLVWSRAMERRLFLPHAQVLMMSARSKRVASKGLELACWVADRFDRRLPDEAGVFAFEWQPAEVLDDVDSKGAHSRRRLRQRPLNPFHLDLAGFLQILIDVMVSCPVPSLRARGHLAVGTFLSATDEASRFRVLIRLIERCPWPNATGLLLDIFRHEMDRASRAFRRASDEPSLPVLAETGIDRAGNCASRPLCSPLVDGNENRDLSGVAVVNADPPSVRIGAPGERPLETPETLASSFTSAQAGTFVCEQLRRACRKVPVASLLVDMDSRTGGLVLARYAHALDRLSSGAGGWGVAGKLELRRPDMLHETVLLVKGFLDYLRGVAITRQDAGPEFFRLFILEDACQQCLLELLR